VVVSEVRVATASPTLWMMVEDGLAGGGRDTSGGFDILKEYIHTDKREGLRLNGFHKTLEDRLANV
jgi:hypothetical protein